MLQNRASSAESAKERVPWMRHSILRERRPIDAIRSVRESQFLSRLQRWPRFFVVYLGLVDST
jgi:hypothetical protein